MSASDDPVASAKALAKELTGKGYKLDFTMKSLEAEIDRLLEDRFLPLGTENVEDHVKVARLGAYIGETLRREFKGKWEGRFEESSWKVFYNESRVVFPNLKLNPYSYMWWRLSAGKERAGGNFSKRLKDDIRRIERGNLWA